MNDFGNPPLRSERPENAYEKQLTQHVLTTLTGNLSAPLTDPYGHRGFLLIAYGKPYGLLTEPYGNHVILMIFNKLR